VVEASKEVRVDTDVDTGSSKRTVFCGKFAAAAAGCGITNPVDVAAAAGLPKAKLPKPGAVVAALVVVAAAFAL